MLVNTIKIQSLNAYHGGANLTLTVKQCLRAVLPENHLAKWTCSAMNKLKVHVVILFSGVAPSLAARPANHISQLSSTANASLQEHPHGMHSSLFLSLFLLRVLFISIAPSLAT